MSSHWCRLIGVVSLVLMNEAEHHRATGCIQWLDRRQQHNRAVYDCMVPMLATDQHVDAD